MFETLEDEISYQSPPHHWSDIAYAAREFEKQMAMAARMVIVENLKSKSESKMESDILFIRAARR